MSRTAIGMVETVGLLAAYEAADAAVKSANVKLVGYEKSSGGMVVIKFSGDIGAVKSAVDAAVAAASRLGKVFSSHVIPRPHQDVDKKMIFTGDTVGYQKDKTPEESAEKIEEAQEKLEIKESKEETEKELKTAESEINESEAEEEIDSEVEEFGPEFEEEAEEEIEEMEEEAGEQLSRAQELKDLTENQKEKVASISENFTSPAKKKLFEKLASFQLLENPRVVRDNNFQKYETLDGLPKEIKMLFEDQGEEVNNI